MAIYTRTGDKGTTSLIGGERVPKYDKRVEAYGTVDELSAHVALLMDIMKEIQIEEFSNDILSILNDLMDVEALLAVGECGGGKVKDMDETRVEWLESRIDEISALLPKVHKFLLPGGDKVISQANVCRTVCRRAERRIAEVGNVRSVSVVVSAYINRLSDYLYVLGRRAYELIGVAENYWMPR